MYLQLFRCLLEFHTVKTQLNYFEILFFCLLERWEKEIDWMAMNGINLLYATTAMEYIYNKVCILEEQHNNSLIVFRYFYEWVFLNQNLMSISRVQHF